jgi:hypothetical protein
MRVSRELGVNSVVESTRQVDAPRVCAPRRSVEDGTVNPGPSGRAADLCGGDGREDRHESVRARQLADLAADATADGRPASLAATAVSAIWARLSGGEEATVAIAGVVEAVFGGGSATTDPARPDGGPIIDQWPAACLANRATIDRIVAAVLGILADGE